jgi:hypothetical protein
MPNSVESDDQPSTEEQIERELIVNIVYLNYNDLSTNLIATINVSKKIVLAERYGDMLIFVENLPDENGENAKFVMPNLSLVNSKKMVVKFSHGCISVECLVTRLYSKDDREKYTFQSSYH